MKQNILITIITVSLNSIETIEKTILSVLNQTYKNIEYIIIDGGSTDGTIDIIKKYQDRISYWQSEKDNGIFDAMNKGLSFSTGDYINFMNSDDYFFSCEVVSKISNLLDQNYDIIYGNAEFRNKNINWIRIEPKPKYLWMGPVNHQGSFIKRDTMAKYKFNIQNKMLADYELFLNVYYNNGKILKIDEIIASYSNEGNSGKDYSELIKNSYKTITKFNRSIFVKAYYKGIFLKLFLKKIIPKKIYDFIKNIYKKL